MYSTFTFCILSFQHFFLFNKTVKSATVWKCLPLISSISIPSSGSTRTPDHPTISQPQKPELYIIVIISIPSSGSTRPPHHPRNILTAKTRKPTNYDQFYWNLPEGNILAKFSVASLFLFIFLLWSPRWNFRAISFNDIRTKASVGPGKAVQL